MLKLIASMVGAVFVTGLLVVAVFMMLIDWTADRIPASVPAPESLLLIDTN